MKLEKALRNFRRFSLLTIFSVLFLIWVGGWVRSTGSGMGCPDWPKCFGLWVPPVEEAQLPPNYLDHFAEIRLKKNERLAKMLNAFGMNDMAEKVLNDPRVSEREEFNVYKTWTEYVNRLVGVLVGLFIFITLIASWPIRKNYPGVFALSLSGFIGVAFEGWLGSLVVSTNLLPSLITVHMLVAMLILVVLIMAYMKTISVQSVDSIPRHLTLTGLVVSLIALFQVILGTRVRESVDVVSKLLGDAERSNWISNLGNDYQIHVRFYWLLLGGLLFWNYRMFPFFKQISALRKAQNLLAVLLLIEIGLGLSMHYFAIPPIAQPMHLMLGTAIFTLVFYITNLLLIHRQKI